MKILKFGGKSLAAGKDFDTVIGIIKINIKTEKLAVVVSAIGPTTDTLIHLINLAKTSGDFRNEFDLFKKSLGKNSKLINEELHTLENLLTGVRLLGDCSLKIRDRILAQGEIIAGKLISNQLILQGLSAVVADSRQFFITDENFGNACPNEEISRIKTKEFFQKLPKNSIPIVPGFIGSTPYGDTVTFGRNGSNYSAALLADYLDAKELQNYTHVDGIFTANPEWVKGARKIAELHFDEANELARSGAHILHAKTIYPLVKNRIPLRILNTLNPFEKGTLISARPTPSGFKSLAADNQVALIRLEGRGLLGIPGVDGRIFSALAAHNLSVGVISQGASERGVAFTVHQEDAQSTREALLREFEKDIEKGDVHSVSIQKDIGVISIIGQDLSNFDKAYSALIRNKIRPIMFNNAVTGKNISLIVPEVDVKKAVNVIHGQIYGVEKTINLALFGHGGVGGTLIEQLLSSAEKIAGKKNIHLRIFAIANSQKIIFDTDGLTENWESRLKHEGKPYSVEDLIDFSKKHHLENLIAVDNTASREIIEHYPTLIENGFDLVSSNKIANTVSYEFYSHLRKLLTQNHKRYLYETNVGAGLPLIDNLKLLHLSGEKITKIKGVFSGSLSYIFNKFSVSNQSFSEVIAEAAQQGLTEPDPREDLSGNDVARKLLILARELDLKNEFEDIEIQNLIPQKISNQSAADFIEKPEILNAHYESIKQNLPSKSVLRYVGELDCQKETLKTALEVIDRNTPLGLLQGADSLFEIYTESYGDYPIVIQGAGAGAAVTARGVFGDILRLAEKEN